MNVFLLVLGSNVNPEKHMPAARTRLKAAFANILFSDFYETDPVGPAGPEKFWNAAAVIKTGLTREEISILLKTIESDLGRKRDSNKFSPRTIDIDMLPREDWQNQAFIMVPLAEIAPEITDPESGKSFAELASVCLEKTKGIKRIERSA